MSGISTLPLAALPVWEAPPPEVEERYQRALAGLSRKIIVLDDDPTGIQTVHGVMVSTGWSRECVLECFRDRAAVSFILTNSRSFSQDHTRAVHREIAENIAWAAGETRRDFVLVSRCDSTLRGHWPLETQVLAGTLARMGRGSFDGEILIPFFPEGGRFTFGNTHYVKEGDTLVPAGETEFARDPTFGYAASSLPAWCQEKTDGACRAEECICVALEDLRALRTDRILRQLLAAENFAKIIVNAVCYEDLKVFCAAYCEALRAGKAFLFRTAAPWVGVLGGIPRRAPLTSADLPARSGSGGMVLAGSYTRKTTLQLEHLKASGCRSRFLEFRAARAAEAGGLEQEAARVAAEVEALLSRGITAVVYTTRDRIALASGEEQLQFSRAVSDAVSSVVGRLTVRPSFLVAKGGITSSDVGVKALGVKRALALGQIAPGVPVWLTGPESKFPELPYVIFPGNVGEEGTLTAVVKTLMDAENCGP